MLPSLSFPYLQKHLITSEQKPRKKRTSANKQIIASADYIGVRAPLDFGRGGGATLLPEKLHNARKVYVVQYSNRSKNKNVHISDI